MLAILTFVQGVVVIDASSEFFAGNDTSLVGGTTTTAGVPPMENGLLGSCKCAGGLVNKFHGETQATFTARSDKGPYGCIGGCDADRWEFHGKHQLVKTITMWWSSDVAKSGMSGMCITLTNDNHKCFGTPNRSEGGGKCTHTFNVDKEEALWTLELDGNGVGSRLGRLAFTTMDNTGKARSFQCGKQHTPYKAINLKGKMISGFFGLAGDDIDQLGVLLASPKCTVLSREIIDVECVNKEGTNCLATWTDGGNFATVEQICDGCETTQQGTCAFDFSLTQSHSVTTTSTSMNTAGGSLSFSHEASIDFLGMAKAGATATVTATYSHTWGHSEAQTVTTTTAVDTKCSVTMQGGTSVMASGNMHAGTMVADMKFHVRTKTKCGQETYEVHDGTTTIANVAVLAEVSKCHFEDVSCDATPAPISSAVQSSAAEEEWLRNLTPHNARFIPDGSAVETTAGPKSLAKRLAGEPCKSN